MGILDQIEKLQKKPKHVREKILAASVAILMIMIVALWIQATRSSFSLSRQENTENPLKVLWSTANDGFKTIKQSEQLTEAIKQFNDWIGQR